MDANPKAVILLGTLARVIIAGLFIYAGILKALNPAGFLADLKTYRLLPHFLGVLLCLYLPYVEIAAGVGVFIRPLRPGALLLLWAMLGTFTFALAQAWLRGLEISCGCFGTTGKMVSSGGLVLTLWPALLPVQSHSPRMGRGFPLPVPPPHGGAYAGAIRNRRIPIMTVDRNSDSDDNHRSNRKRLPMLSFNILFLLRMRPTSLFALLLTGLTNAACFAQLSPEQALASAQSFLLRQSQAAHSPFKNWAGSQLDAPCVYANPHGQPALWVVPILNGDHQTAGYVALSLADGAIREFSNGVAPHQSNLAPYETAARRAAGARKLGKARCLFLGGPVYALEFPWLTKERPAAAGLPPFGDGVLLEMDHLKVINGQIPPQNRPLKKSAPPGDVTKGKRTNRVAPVYRVLEGIPDLAYYLSDGATSVATVLKYWEDRGAIALGGRFGHEDPAQFVAGLVEKGCTACHKRRGPLDKPPDQAAMNALIVKHRAARCADCHEAGGKIKAAQADHQGLVMELAEAGCGCHLDTLIAKFARLRGYRVATQHFALPAERGKEPATFDLYKKSIEKGAPVLVVFTALGSLKATLVGRGYYTDGSGEFIGVKKDSALHFYNFDAGSERLELTLLSQPQKDPAAPARPADAAGGTPSPASVLQMEKRDRELIKTRSATK